MPIPHFSVIQTHRSNWDPVYKNLYECTIILPTLLQAIHPNATTLLLENAISVNLPTYPELPTISQKYKYSTRLFLGTPESTSITDLNVKFNLNQNDDYQVFIWRILKDWYDLAWNNESGALHYKKNMLGSIIVHVHDREGHVIRRVTYHNVQMKNFEGWNELSWDENGSIEDFTGKFIADWWQDYYV